VVTKLLIAGAVVVIALLLYLRFSMRSLATRRERFLALVAMAVLPMMWLLGMLGYTDAATKKASFCMKCHEMRIYGESLHVDDESLAAVHYRNGLVDRKKPCYTCHTAPGLRGLAVAKYKGLHDVYVHYLREVPEEIEHLGPYDHATCLGCHGESASFLEGWGHSSPSTLIDDLKSGEFSCLDCHDMAHNLDEE
jgi:nitrate/TMAO reductase-like tetraheme cytochrome c subunit